MEREFDDVAAVVDSLGEPVHLLGHSYGALCALEAALRTRAVRSLTLYEPGIEVAGEEIYPPATIDRLEALLAVGDPLSVLSGCASAVMRSRSGMRCRMVIFSGPMRTSLTSSLSTRQRSSVVEVSARDRSSDRRAGDLPVARRCWPPTPVLQAVDGLAVGLRPVGELLLREVAPLGAQHRPEPGGQAHPLCARSRSGPLAASAYR